MADEKTNGTNGGEHASPIPPKIRLNLGQAGAKKPDTSRIDLAAAEPSTIETAGAGEALSVRDVIGEPPKTTVRPPVSATVKAQTSRISIHDSQPVGAGEAIPVAKASTSRIALRDSQRVTPFEAAAVPKAATSKVATGAIAAAGGPVEQITQQAALGRTARIMIDGPDEALPTGGSLGDTGKMTIPADVAAKAAPPKTVRLQRPSAAPKTVILKRPDAGAAPKTVVLKRPDAPAEPVHQPVMAPPTQGPKTVQLNAAGEAEQKGATARISIPDGAVDTSAPPTQRKTIRIKRGGEGPSTGAKTLVLQRPVVPEGEPGAAGLPEGATPAQIAEAELSRALGVQEVDEPGVGYAIVAILAFLVVGTLLYALLAQTYFPTLPMPAPLA